MAKLISLEEGEELRRLYAELPEAQRRVASALRAGGFPLVGAAIARLMEEHEKEAAIVRRIKEICG
jgi:hypothetical protein